VTVDLRQLGRVDYEPTYAAMQAFTEARTADTSDELWVCEHPSVFTLGLAGKAGHLLAPGDIAVIATNRGGQVTYHGPGQVVAYPLLDLKRAGYFVKEYVYRLEESVIRTLMHFGVTGHRVAGAPGIYVRLDDPFSHARLPSPPPSPGGRGGDNPASPPLPPGEGGGKSGPFDQLLASGIEVGKIAALGIKVSRNCTYHGVALNVAMDLEPYSRINPCGYAGLRSVDLSTIGVSADWAEVADLLGQKLIAYLTS
jgi:lipoyl(octanoyl) transferase